MIKLRLSEPIFNKEKIREIILYVLNKIPNLDEEILCNILYFIDLIFTKNMKNI